MMGKATNKSFRDEELNRLLGDEYLLSVDQAALYLGVSASTLNHWRSDAKGPRFVKLCGSSRGAIRYRLKDIRTYVEKNSFDSVAEAELSNAMSRVSVSLEAWTIPHPFIVKGAHFIVDSALRDRGTFVSVFQDPFVRLKWLSPVSALKRPWLKSEQRLALFQQYANTEAGKDKAGEVRGAYIQSLRQIPEQLWCGHPDLTLQTLQASNRGLSYPVEFSS